MLRRGAKVVMTAVVAALALAGTTLLSGSARAQDASTKGSLALNQFDPSPAGDAFFNVPSPYVHGKYFEPRAQLTLDYAEKPLRLFDDQKSANLVGRQVFLHANVSMAIVDRLLVSLMLPVAVVQSGDDPIIQGTATTSPDEAQVGDMRIGLRVRIYGEPESPFQLGVGNYLYVPTGAEQSFVGEGTVRAQPYLALGGQFEGGVPWVWTASAGVLARASDNPSSFRYGAGIAALLLKDVIQVGPEVYASTPFFSRKFKLTARDSVDINNSTNLEIMLGAKVRLWHFQAGVMGGPGMTRAAGTPSFRLAWSLAYNPPIEKPDNSGADTDEDGVLNRYDACPYAHGTANADPKLNGCPRLDDDEDTVPNNEDACPNEYGVPSSDPKTNGCPAPSIAAAHPPRGGWSTARF